MVVWGVSALSHDAAITVVEGREIRFAAHAERFSRTKSDPSLPPGLIDAALEFGAPQQIAWYERPGVKKLRHLRAGQYGAAFQRDDLPRRYLASLGLPFPVPPIDYVPHHASHAAAGSATAPFAPPMVVIVADAIGEFDCLSVRYLDAEGTTTVLERDRYPRSWGLLYSAFTRRCGFRPNDEEFILMGLSAYGQPVHADAIRREFLRGTPEAVRVARNVHRGIGDWLPDATPADLAASIQLVLEEAMVATARRAQLQTGCRAAVLMGGVALNCLVNSRIAEAGLFDHLWIMPNPGDAGSSLGAAAHVTGALDWRGPYLGTTIGGGDYPVDDLLESLLRDGMAGVAWGPAEFGPRALGNRSLLADPRGADMQDRVNAVKGREPFRPFAPVVREERAADLFAMPVAASPYMQFVTRCRRPDELPAVCHVDGTSRVQTVSQEQHPGLHQLLGEWEAATGCPVLLNTSLNVKGEPLVDSLDDAARFAGSTGVRVCTGG